MKRHFRPANVHQTASALMETGHPKKPAWFDIVGTLPPAQGLVRKQPLPHQRRKLPKGSRRANKLYHPQRITYEEDSLRQDFFRDHPWELARPRLVIEGEARDMHSSEWSHLEQRRTALSGESVVQHQRWLLQQDKSLTRAQAYDQARKKFYELRLFEDIERRVAKEEALAAGAYFGKSAIEVGMEIEDQFWIRWQARAEEEVEREMQEQQALNASAASLSEEGTEPGTSQVNDRSRLP